MCVCVLCAYCLCVSVLVFLCVCIFSTQGQMRCHRKAGGCDTAEEQLTGLEDTLPVEVVHRGEGYTHRRD